MFSRMVKKFRPLLQANRHTRPVYTLTRSNNNGQSHPRRQFTQVPNFSGRELQVESQEIRNRLSESVSLKGIKGTFFTSLFNIRPIKSELFDFRKYLTQEQTQFVNSLEEHSYQLILDEHLSILEKFYRGKQKDNSNLGSLYRKITFNEMLCRLIKARYEAAYQDGRLLSFRNGHEELIQPLKDLSDRDKLLAVGTDLDTGKLYEHYLMLEESALSHLVSANGYFLPIENGVRYRNNGIVPNYRSGNTLDEFKKAHAGPVLINYAVGPELRNGLSLHYDALMCIECENEEPGQAHFDRRANALNSIGFGSVAQDLYGDEYPQGPKPREQCQVIQFNVPGSKFGSTSAYFYVNAYKTRLRHTLKQTLIANDLFLPEPGIIRLKGLGLGVFGISSLDLELENIYLEVLNELINTLPLEKINTVELLNFPSIMKRFDMNPGDLDYYMEHENDASFPARIVQHPTIKIVQRLTPCLSDAEGAYLSTQVCGDSISRPGNEGAIGLPPSSSDEASMYYSLAGIGALRSHTELSNEELMRKIIITDGLHCTTIDGMEQELDLSSLKTGLFNKTIVLKTEPMAFEKAVQVMDHINAVRGVVSRLKREDQDYRVLLEIHPGYDRDRFFGKDKAHNWAKDLESGTIKLFKVS